MLISMALILLLSPVPSLQASIGEGKNSSNLAPHAVNLNVLPKPVTTVLNVKPKPSTASSASQTAKLPGNNNAQKTSKDAPPLSSTIRVIISQACVQTDHQKDSINATRVQEVELNIKPGSPLIMKHQISVEISACTDECEAQVETLKGRIHLLEKEVTTLKKTCCELDVETVTMKVPESGTIKQEAVKTTKADKMIFEKKANHEKESKKDKKPTAKPSTNSTVNDHNDENRNKALLKDGKGQEQTKRSKTAVLKTEPDKQIQTDLLINLSTKQEMAEKPSTKQEKLKDMLVNYNITQTTEKKTNGTSYPVLPSLAKEAKTSTDSKTSSGKVNHSQSNVTSTTTKRAESVIVKGEVSGHKKLEKHGNGTVSIKKEKKQLQGNATLSKVGPFPKKKVEKHINVTSLTEKDKKLHQVNMTLLGDRASSNINVEKHENIHKPSGKDKTQFQASAILLKDGSSGKVNSHINVPSPEKDTKLFQSNVTTVLKRGKNNLESHLNVTAPPTKDKKSSYSNETTTLKEVTSSKKTVEKHVVPFSTEKDKKSHPVNATLVKGEASGSKKVEKLRNVTSTEKDKKLQQVDVTAPLKDTTLTKKKHVNVTISPDKSKKLHQVSVILPKEEASGKRKAEKQVNLMVSTGKNTPQHQGNGTLLKEGKNKMEKHGNVTISWKSHTKKQQQVNATLLKEEASERKKINTITVSEEKTKKQLQSNATASLPEKATRKEKLGSQRNTTSNSKDKELQQDSKTSALKEGGATKRKDFSGINKMLSTKKSKNIHISGTTSLNKATFERKKVAVSTDKDKKAPRENATLPKEDAVAQKMVDVVTVSEEKGKKQLPGSRLNTTNIEAKTTKLKDISSVEVHNITATGFVITWEAPQGEFKNFTVTRREVLTSSKDEEAVQKSGKSQDSGDEVEILSKNEAEIHDSNRTSTVHNGQADRKIVKKFSQVLSGTARSFHFTNLQPQTRYLVSLYSSRPRGPYKLHRLFVSTGPAPPTELVFSNITETSLSVSWTKPKSIVTGFRVTYTNTGNGDTGSMSVDSQLSQVLISKLSAGFTYEISVRSILGTIESEPSTASVTTVADPPTDLQAVNITDTKALMVWKPAQAKVDHYILSYTSAKSPNVTVTVMVSGSSVEHQLRGLHRFTHYTVKLTSQISNLQSRSISTTFTTTSGVKLQAVIPTQITFSSAVISWKAPQLAFRSYKLTYQHGRNSKEVVLNPTMTQYELTGLAAFSNYTVKVDGEMEGQYINIVSTAFTTAQVPFPHPSDCSQVLLNGVTESGEMEVYPDGNDGEPVWVYCDMETDGGGWTVFQRRMDGSVDFFRGWNDYSKGFGLLTAEFWLGNDVLHSLTSLTPVTLRIDLQYGNDTAYAHYSNFTVASEANHYAINLSGYSGTAGDSMRYHNGRPFSTKDKDPKPFSIHCAKAYMGGWWYKNCYKANLNGLYSTFSQNQGVVWIDWKGKDVSIPFTEMKLRPASLRRITPQG